MRLRKLYEIGAAYLATILQEDVQHIGKKFRITILYANDLKYII